MSYDHKISDLKYRINSLVPKNICQKIIEVFEKYPELNEQESSYKFKTKKHEIDNFSCLNLSRIENPNEDISYALNEAKKYIFIMITNYVLHIKCKKISPTFNNFLINRTDNLNEDYEGGEFRFFDGQIKESFKTGDAMIFPAEPIWIHGTEPITKGIRYSINCFLYP